MESPSRLSVHCLGVLFMSNIPWLTWISLNPADCGKYMTVLKVELDSPLTLYSGEGAVISQN